jgi:uncharacterized protein YjbJ (UPF0337 family)
VTEQGQARRSRRNIVESVKGKLKEVAGAVSGNDSLTTEGQLEQTAARERRNAASEQAEATAQAGEAERLARAADLEGAQNRLETTLETAKQKRAIEEQRDVAQRTAEEAGAEDAARAEMTIEAQAQSEISRAEGAEREQFESAAKEHLEAIEGHRRAEASAAKARAEADRLRAEAEKGES